jgi:hypothetical protein
VSVDRSLERLVLAELALLERRHTRHPPFGSSAARALAHKVHAGHDDLLMHLRRVAGAVPEHFRRVAWLHHAVVDQVMTDDLAAAGLHVNEVAAVRLLAGDDSGCDVHLLRTPTIVAASGMPGHLARVVARAAVADRLREEAA